MATVSLSPVLNGQQQFDNQGVPLSGGKIFQYFAGSDSNQATTYTDNNGSVANSNPIVLDSSGRLPAEIWLINGTNYNLVVTLPDGTTVLEHLDNIVGTVQTSPSDALPDQTGHAGEFLTTDGTTASWADAAGLPPQDDSTNGQVLTSVDEVATWVTPGGGSGSAPIFVVQLTSDKVTVNQFDGTLYDIGAFSPQVLIESADAQFDDGVLSVNRSGFYRITTITALDPYFGDPFMSSGLTTYGTQVSPPSGQTLGISMSAYGITVVEDDANLPFLTGPHFGDQYIVAASANDQIPIAVYAKNYLVSSGTGYTVSIGVTCQWIGDIGV